MPDSNISQTNTTRSIGITDTDVGNSIQRDNHLLLIAIDNYRYWPKLHNPVSDLEAISKVLIREYSFKEENILRIYNEDATEQNIRNALIDLNKKLTTKDNLIIFYSGHGHYDNEIKLGYWVPYNAQKDDPASYISNADIAHLLKVINTHHTLLVADSCFAGSLITQHRGATRLEEFPSKRVFSSGRIEVVEDGPAGEHSPFARGILTFLNNNIAAARITHLIEYVKDYVEKFSKQTPIDGKLPNDGSGELVLYRRISQEEIWNYILRTRTPEAIRKYLDLYPDGKYREKALAILEEIKADDALWEEALKRGTPDDFKEYITKHTNGRHMKQAQDYIDSYYNSIREKEKVLEQVQNKVGELERIRTKYRQAADRAEQLFRNKKYRDARALYWECKSLFLPTAGFTPDVQYLTNKITECNRMINFTDNYTAGEKAFLDKNYSLAKEHFNRALSFKEDSHTRQLLLQCERKQKTVVVRPPEKPRVRVQASEQPSPPQSPPLYPLPKRNPFNALIVAAFIMITLILSIILAYFYYQA